MTLLVALACFATFVWLACRLKALDDRTGPRDGFPASERRKEWK